MLAHKLSPPAPRRLTRAEYHRMGELEFFRGERVQLVDGMVVRMPPIGPPHACIVDRLAELLIPCLVGRATVRVQQPLVANDDSEPEPDIAVVPRADYSRHHPDRALLVVEVAESSLSYDCETKGALYADAGVSEYWIVDVAGRAIEAYRTPVDGQYSDVQRAVAGETMTVAAFPDVVLAVEEILG